MAKRKQTESSIYDIYKSFSDLALMTLGAFLFLFVIIILVSQTSTSAEEVSRLKAALAKEEQKLKLAEADRARLEEDLEKMASTSPDREANVILKSAGVTHKDFDVFINGLRNIPGRDLHLVIDATGSMHGVSGFLIPLLRLIVNRADKQVSAITWFSDYRFQTETGTMGDMFDQFMQGAPFTGSYEYIGRAFSTAIGDSPRPGAYLLIGDEPSDDTINYSDIPSPVFTLPLGRSDPDTERDYGILADKTGGKVLHIELH
jgi:hypothetical protein